MWTAVLPDRARVSSIAVEGSAPGPTVPSAKIMVSSAGMR